MLNIFRKKISLWGRNSIDVVVDNLDNCVFHYIDRPTRPDIIQVFRKDNLEKPIFVFNWIDGVETVPGSKLNKIYLKYLERSEERRQRDKLIGNSGPVS